MSQCRCSEHDRLPVGEEVTGALVDPNVGASVVSGSLVVVVVCAVLCCTPGVVVGVTAQMALSAQHRTDATVADALEQVSGRETAFLLSPAAV